jgi:hypothetical protein
MRLSVILDFRGGLLVAFDLDHLRAAVSAAVGADVVSKSIRTAVRARLKLLQRERIVGTPAIAPAGRMTFLGKRTHSETPLGPN